LRELFDRSLQGETNMQNLLGLLATVAVLVAMSGVVPMAYLFSAAAEETRTARIMDPTKSPPALCEAKVDIDSLTIDSDFSVYMGPDCPPAIRSKALQKLWTLLPPTPVEDNSAI
jgi:hypothetical protein